MQPISGISVSLACFFIHYATKLYIFAVNSAKKWQQNAWHVVFFAIFAPTHLKIYIMNQKHTTLLDVNDFRYSLYRSRFTLSREEAAQLRYLCI